MENQRTSERYVKTKTQQQIYMDNKKPPPPQLRVEIFNEPRIKTIERNQNYVEESKNPHLLDAFNLVDH